MGEFALLHWRCLGQDACHDMMKHAAARNKAADRASMWLVAPPRNLRRTLKIEKTQIPEFPSDMQMRKRIKFRNVPSILILILILVLILILILILILYDTIRYYTILYNIIRY